MSEENKRPMGDDIDPTDAESLRSPRPISRGLIGQPAPAKFIAKHTVQPGDTLGSIALKYYKNASQKYYMAIYEANKSIIGDNPNKIGLGMVLNIPESPAD
jgi:nucleoid-associated protein YgaU